MGGLAHFPLYVEDFWLDTEHLSDAEVGLYFRMIMAAWRAPDNSLPEDPVATCKILRITGHNRSRVEAILDRFFHLENGRWRQKRLDKERRKAEALHAQRVHASEQALLAKALKKQKARVPSGKPKQHPSGPPNPDLSFGKKGARARARGISSDFEGGQTEALNQVAERVKSGKRFLCTSITAATARRMLEAELVTVDECKAVGVL